MARKKKTPLFEVETKDSKYVVKINGCDGKYLINRVFDISPLYTLEKNKTGELVVSRNVDFGGLGKDAIKREKNIPLKVWLNSVYASWIEDSIEVEDSIERIGL